jgi:hypothetical protein
LDGRRYLECEKDETLFTLTNQFGMPCKLL